MRFLLNKGVIRLRTLRREPALTQFETAQIANLCPGNAEEAKSVIPRYSSSERQNEIITTLLTCLQSCQDRR